MAKRENHESDTRNQHTRSIDIPSGGKHNDVELLLCGIPGGGGGIKPGGGGKLILGCWRCRGKSLWLM